MGRGTSTFDGLSLAWACADELVQKAGSYTLFATHYFEMTQLAENLDNVVNVHLTATEHKDHIIFMHHVEEGPASQSYGLQVAKLAGVPEAVIDQAKSKLVSLEDSSVLDSIVASSDVVMTKAEKPAPQTKAPEAVVQAHSPQPDMFAMAPEPSKVEEALKEISPDELSPRQALELLYELKGKL